MGNIRRTPHEVLRRDSHIADSFCGNTPCLFPRFFHGIVHLRTGLKGWAVLYPRFKTTPYVDPSELVILFFVTVVPYTVATIIPAWRTALVDPDSVMR